MYERHPFCELFPDVTPAELRELADDIAANGLTNPVVLWGDVVLDGKNRLKACELAGVEPTFRKWKPTSKATGDAEALAYCMSQNNHRRHLDETQRGMVAARFAKETAKIASLNAAKDSLPPNGGTIRESAAKEMNVSTRTVERGTAVLEKGSKALQKAVDAGDVRLGDAAKIVNLPKVEQSAAVRAVSSGAASTVADAAKNPKRVADYAAEAKSKNQPTEETLAVDAPVEAMVKLMAKLARCIEEVRVAIDEKAKIPKTFREMQTIKGSFVKKLDALGVSVAAITESIAVLSDSWLVNRKLVDNLP